MCVSRLGVLNFLDEILCSARDVARVVVGSVGGRVVVCPVWSVLRAARCVLCDMCLLIWYVNLCCFDALCCFARDTCCA